MFSNFFSNLWNQLKDPTRFHFFRVPGRGGAAGSRRFRQRESQSVKTGEPLVAQYEVQPPVQAQQQTQAGQQQQSEGVPQQSAGQTEQNPQYKYRPEDIDWNSLAALGVQREQIEGNGMLDQMLRGFQTDKTVRCISTSTASRTATTAAFAQARHGRQADRVQPRHPRPGEDAEAVLRLRHHRLRQAGAPADGQHGTPGYCHQPGGRAGRSPCQPQPQDQRAGRLPALQGQYPGGEERAYLHTGRDSPAQTGRGGGLPVPSRARRGSSPSSTRHPCSSAQPRCSSNFSSATGAGWRWMRTRRT